MLVVRRASSSLAEFAAPHETTTMSAAVGLALAVALDDDLGDRRARGVGLQLDGLGVVSSVTFGCSSAGRTASTSASDLAWTRQGKPSQVGAADARAVGHVLLVQHDPAGRVERMEAGRRQIVGQLLDARLVGDRPETDMARSPAARSDPRRARRGPGRAARPGCSRAPSPRRRWARRARCRRGGAARRSPPRADGRARRRTSWWRRRRSSGPAAGTACRRRRTRCPSRCSGCRRRRPRRPSSAARGAASRRARAQDPLARRGEAADQRAAACAGADDDHVVGQAPHDGDPRARASGRGRRRAVGRLGPPGALRVGVHRRRGVEQRLHDPPGLLDAVLTGEARALARPSRPAAGPRTASGPRRPPRRTPCRG